MNENKSLKVLGVVMIILGSIINIVPELISSIVSVIIVLGGLLLLKNSLSKKVAIASVVLNGLSLVVCAFCLIAQLSHSGDSFKLGSFPMDVTCFISIALTIVVIVFTFVILKKRTNKE